MDPVTLARRRAEMEAAEAEAARARMEAEAEAARARAEADARRKEQIRETVVKMAMQKPDALTEVLANWLNQDGSKPSSANGRA